jgi:heme exporter protein CcmD
VVVGALIGWIVADHRAQMRTLADLEARGIARRSSTVEAT